MREHPTIDGERLKAIPKKAGVYIMRNSKGDAIYVGKAKNLFNRVRNYFGSGDGRYNVEYIFENVDSIETLVTENERQALILEADLIRKFKPRYNIRLKDDKAYLIVRIDKTHEWPRIELVRQRKNDAATYIGPFAFAYEVRTLLAVINRTLLIRTCSDRMLYNRVRPCLEYQIKRCCGPCCLEVDRAWYFEMLEQAEAILKGSTDAVVRSLQALMERASEEERFEDAASYRDRLEILERIQEDSTEVNFGRGSKDAFGVYREGTSVEVSCLMVRTGRLAAGKTFGFEDTALPDEEILGSLIQQYYQMQDMPDEVLLPLGLEASDAHEQLLSERRGKRVKLVVAKRGVNRRLLELASENAQENFSARFGSDRHSRGLKELGELLELESMPRTIECVDISHFQGAQTVASVVSFKDGEPDTDRYRRFIVSSAEGKPDDFQGMREVVERHLGRAFDEGTLADLMVVDGGPAQLSQAIRIREKLGAPGPVMIGLAKKRTGGRTGEKPERVYVEDAPLPKLLLPESAVCLLLARIRDEAHRFAITFHRERRTTSTLRSVLDDAPGIGKKRKLALLQAFGSPKRIKEASAEEIHQQAGLPLKLAERLLEYLAK